MCQKKNNKPSGRLCLSPPVLQIVALALIALGVLLIFLFVPLRYWMAILGVLLIAAGVALRVLFS